MRRLVFSLAFVSVLSATRANASDWEGVHFANYVEAKDLPTVRDLGITAVVMEFDTDPKQWTSAYNACIKNSIRVVPVLWGKHQSIWKWNSSASEWELDVAKYPNSKGAKFLAFLQKHPQYQRQTFAVYAFHEPWYASDTGRKKKRKGTVPPPQLRKFWQQIHLMFSGKLKVYGEEVTWVADCKNGCVDYDYITLYSFATSRKGQPVYRPGGRKLVSRFGIDGAHAPVQADREKAKQQEREQIRLMHDAIQSAPAAADGSRTKLIALMGTFAHNEERELWNRMPSVEEMQQWIDHIVLPERDRLAGLGWYAFRNPTDYYTSYLHRNRRDDEGKDRWQAIKEISKRLPNPTSR